VQVIGSIDPPQLVPLSALQHWAYRPRQRGLIHLGQAFDDNVHTLRGNAEHARTDQPGAELVASKGLRVERALPLWHDELGLIGKSDAVERLSIGVTNQPCRFDLSGWSASGFCERSVCCHSE
jgi:CRISPR-associated exonuclease Cas4